ncbi:MAG: lipopolysaccharide biosynthesis protein [Geobacter sp.]|nr:lipopolysaccharide biosynthesis protein [Geobacter sp.]
MRDFLSVLFRYKLTVVIVLVAIVITVTLISFLLPPVYEAKSTILVKFGREYINRPEVGDSRPLMSLNQEEVINSEIQILTNHDLIAKVITTITIAKIYPELAKQPPSKMAPLETAVLEFEKKLTVEGVRKSNVIRISFRHEDPQISAMAVNLLVEMYREKHLQVFSEPRSSFLESQLVSYEHKLKSAEDKLEVFKQKNRLFSIDEQRTLLLNQRMELDNSLKSSQNSFDELQKKFSYLKNQMKSATGERALYTQTERDKIIVEAKSKLLNLQLNELELLKKYKEGNRLVINNRKEISLVQGFLKEQEHDIGDKVKSGSPVYQSLEIELIKTEAELNAQQAKAAKLKQQIVQVDGEIQALDLRGKEMQNLNREKIISEKNYLTYADRFEEARISDDLDRMKLSNISVIQPASVPAKPVKPRKLLNIALGIIFGAVSGVGSAFLSAYAAQTLTTPESAEFHLGVPVLTSIAHNNELESDSKQKDRLSYPICQIDNLGKQGLTSFETSVE